MAYEPETPQHMSPVETAPEPERGAPMTTPTPTPFHTTTTTSRTQGWAKLAGLGYAGAWVLGLVALGGGPGLSASAEQVDAYFAGHRTVSAVQGVLIHGIAAAALLAVVVAIGHRGVLTRPARFGGAAAVGLSFIQCGLDLWRSLLSTGATTVSLVHVIDRIDGLKMLALALMIGTSVSVFRAAALIGTKMAVTGWVATVALGLSGVGYVLANTALAVVANLSLVLLLIWIAYSGVAVARSSR